MECHRFFLKIPRTTCVRFWPWFIIKVSRGSKKFGQHWFRDMTSRYIQHWYILSFWSFKSYFNLNHIFLTQLWIQTLKIYYFKHPNNKNLQQFTSNVHIRFHKSQLSLVQLSIIEITLNVQSILKFNGIFFSLVIFLTLFSSTFN